MKMMRDFLTDPKLHKILDEIEEWIGYPLPALPMPPELYEKARCRMRIEAGRFEFLFIEKDPQSQATYCHEMAHASLFINGAVTKYYFMPPVPLVFSTLPIRHFSEQIWEYMQHVPVFELVKELGYDERPDYTPVAVGLIKLLRQNELFSVMDVPSLDPLKDQIRCQVGALTQCLALPMAEEIRYALRRAALEMLPQSLELADAILAALGARTLLGPQEYQEYLWEIYHIVGLPRANLLFSFEDKICPNFRSRILEAASS